MGWGSRSRLSAERFELLEDALRFVHGMWEGDSGSGSALEGRHVHAGRLLNSPQALSRPHPPIMIGGGGRAEDPAPGRAVRRRLQRVRRTRRRSTTSTRSCASTAPRSGATPTRSSARRSSPCAWTSAPASGESPQQVVDRFGELADAGAQHVIFGGAGRRRNPRVIEVLGRDVLPAVHGLS